MEFADIFFCMSLDFTLGQSAQLSFVLVSKDSCIVSILSSSNDATVEDIIRERFHSFLPMYLNKPFNTLPPNPEGVGERH